MADPGIRAGRIWMRRARRKMRIRISDRKRYRSFKRAVNGRSRRRMNGRNYRKEFLTLDARNKLILSRQTNHSLKKFTKLEIKERLFFAGIPVPLTYMTMTDPSEIEVGINYLLLNFRDGFVIKPNDGHSGKGILVIKKIIGRRFITGQNEAWTAERMAVHLERILKGRFSRGRKDIVIVEERINQHHKLRSFTSFGLVDFRLIVLNGYPVMGMARLPTKRSRGKGNLHRGAMGVGINLDDGVLTSGVLNDRPVTKHPDTGMKISGLKIPNWYDIMLTGARAQFFSDLNYAGVDMVVDTKGEIKVLEVNRRPGLAIQLANKAGLRSRLDYIERLTGSEKNTAGAGFDSIKKRVDFSIDKEKTGWAEGGAVK